MLTHSELSEILHIARKSGGDFAEMFFEDRNDTIIKSVDSRIGGVTGLHIYGAGLYVLRGTSSVYLHANDTSFHALKSLAQRAADLIAGADECGLPEPVQFVQKNPATPCPVKIHPGSVPVSKKVRVLRDVEQAAYDAGPAVRSMNVEYFDNTQHVVIVNSEGLYTEDTRTFSRIRLAGTVEYQGKLLYEFTDFVKPKGFETFSEYDVESFAKHTIRQMENRMKAKKVRSCVVPVVFDAGSCGVFWHEACGHNLEATSAKTGCFAGKKGQMIASKKVTLIDDGTVPGLCGSEAIDDEGEPTRSNVLIDRGRMVLQLADRKGGRELGTGSTGSGRRQGYSFAPAARMHNTYLAAGEDDDEEMITSIDNGLLVTEMGGGSSGWNFSVAVQYGYWIRDGKLCEPVSGLTLSGSSTELIKRVDRVGKTIRIDEGGGFCGAASGLVQTTNYQPRFRISSMNVGGVEV